MTSTRSYSLHRPFLGGISQKRVRKRLKKYYPKDFQDTTWTVAVQWNHAKYEVQTTKVRINPPANRLDRFLHAFPAKQ